MSRRRILSLGLLCVLLVGCTGRAPAANRSGSAPAARPAAANSPQTTLTWSVWGNPWELNIDRRVARLFEAEHPGVRIEIVHVEWDQYNGWVQGEWAAGRSPDVLFLNYVPVRAAEGMLEPLDPFIARDAYSLEDFYPALLAQFRYENRYYGLPRDNDTKVIYYNRDAFDLAGVPYPADGWTWEDLRQAALSITRQGVTRYGFGFEKDHWWRIWLWQNGADIVDDAFRPTRVTLNTPAAAAGVDYLAGLINRDRVTPPVEQLNDADLTALFSQGNLEMAFGGHGKVPSFAENPDLHWDVAPLPRGQLAANVAGGAGYVISKLAPDKELAWSFVKFLVSPKGQALFAESGIITPARRSVREENIFLRRQPYTARVFLEETEYGRANMIFAGAGEMSALLDRALDPVWRGERSAAEALAEVAPQLEPLLPR